MRLRPDAHPFSCLPTVPVFHGLQWTLPGVDLQQVVRYASQVAAAVPNTGAEQQWQICNFRIHAAFDSAMQQLVSTGLTYPTYSPAPAIRS